MRVQWDVLTPVSDSNVLRANLVRPDDDTKYPVMLSYGAPERVSPFKKEQKCLGADDRGLS
jgi:hypothetical protein